MCRIMEQEREEGRAEGRVEGRAEGLAEGMMKGCAKTVQDLAKTCSISEIAKLLGRAESEIEGLLAMPIE